MPKNGFRFNNGYQSLDGNGKPVFTIKRSGSKVIYIHNKTGKKSFDTASHPLKTTDKNIITSEK